jgi:hypothetical protein
LFVGGPWLPINDFDDDENFDQWHEYILDRDMTAIHNATPLRRLLDTMMNYGVLHVPDVVASVEPEVHEPGMAESDMADADTAEPDTGGL